MESVWGWSVTYRTSLLSTLKLVLARIEQDLDESDWLIPAQRWREGWQLLAELQAQVGVHRAVRWLLHGVLKHNGNGRAEDVGGRDDPEQLLQQAVELLGRQLVQDALDLTQGLLIRGKMGSAWKSSISTCLVLGSCQESRTFSSDETTAPGR